MDLEKLTKTQIILLTLLVSFVTSIATGIVTVTLMDQAPTDVTRTINRVVEKTVERVVPGETKIVERIKEVSNPTESDMVVSAVGKTENVLVYFKTANGFESRGFFVSRAGDAILSLPDAISIDETIEMKWPNDLAPTSTPMSVKVEKIDYDSGVMLVSPLIISSTTYPFINLKQSVIPVLGARVVSVGYDRVLGFVAGLGSITTFLDPSGREGERRFIADFATGASHIGAPVSDLNARVVGMNMGLVADLPGMVIIPTAKLQRIFEKLLGQENDPSSQAASASEATR